MRVPSIILACVVAMLVGCASVVASNDARSPVEPSATPTPTEAPTSTLPPLPPVPIPEAGTIVISGDQLTIYPPNGSGPYPLPYSLPSREFVDALSELFAEEPQLSSHQSEGDCDPSFDQTTWGGFVVLTNYGWLPTGATVEVNAFVASQNGIAIVSSLGVGVGDDNTAQYAHFDEFTKAREYEGQLHTELNFEVIDSTFLGADGELHEVPVGGYLGAADGVVDVVVAPIVVGLAGAC